MESNILKLLKSAGLAKSKAEGAADKLLSAICQKVKPKTKEDKQFQNNLGIVYQDADGFVLNDNDGNNYSVRDIVSEIDKKGKIVVSDITKYII